MYYSARHRESSENLPDLRKKNAVLAYSSSVIEYIFEVFVFVVIFIIYVLDYVIKHC